MAYCELMLNTLNLKNVDVDIKVDQMLSVKICYVLTQSINESQ